MACRYIQLKGNIPAEITADVLQIPAIGSSIQGKWLVTALYKNGIVEILGIDICSLLLSHWIVFVCLLYLTFLGDRKPTFACQY